MENGSYTFNLPQKVKMIKNINENINFSIVIITENNEDRIGNFLNTLLDFINGGGEIIILDKGSTDNTINIAQEMDCKVEDISNFKRIIDEDIENILLNFFNKDDENDSIKIIDKEYFNYSEIKNYAATLIKNDLILILDINSKIIKFNLDEIIKLTSTYNTLKIQTTKQNDYYYIYNKNEYSWKNIIYEEILVNISVDVSEDIVLISKNKNDIDKDKEKKFTSLLMNCFIDQSNQHLLQLLAIELYKRKNLNSAYNEFNRHISICENDIEKSISYCYIGDYFLNTDRKIDAINSYHKAFNLCEIIRLPLYKLAELYYFDKNWNKCIMYLEGCLLINKTTDIENNNFMYRDGPYSMLYVAWWWKGDQKKGKYYFDKAVKINPYNKLYLEESIYHYEYKPNNIVGSLTFQELQFLYSESKKYNSVLELFPENGRSTHALISGSNNIVTVVREYEDINYTTELGNPGNIEILYINNINETINYLENENRKFDMILIHNYNDIKSWDFINLENFAKKIICGTKYHNNKEKIDMFFEITGIKDNLWFKEISSFEKLIIYERKKEL